MRLHQYAGGPVVDIATIVGEGLIDKNYRQTVKDMAAQCHPGGECSELSIKINVAENVIVNELKNRVALSVSIEVVAGAGVGLAAYGLYKSNPTASPADDVTLMHRPGI